MTDEASRIPRSAELDGLQIDLRLMVRGDLDEVLGFAGELSRHDLLFMRRDITQRSAVEKWVDDIEAGPIQTILARVDESIVGYATLHRSLLPWQSHVAELRMLVSESARGKGLGRLLTQEIFALALEGGVEKMVARMTTDQKGALATFEGLGFHPEALLRDHVKDIDGETHDLVMMCHDVAEFEQTLAAYGVGEQLA